MSIGERELVRSPLAKKPEHPPDTSVLEKIDWIEAHSYVRVGADG